MTELWLKDLQEAYLEYKLGKFTAEDLKEYKPLFLQECAEVYNISDPWQVAKFEQEVVLDGFIPYNDDLEWYSPLTGFTYKDAIALYPDTDRPQDFVLIDNTWMCL